MTQGRQWYEKHNSVNSRMPESGFEREGQCLLNAQFRMTVDSIKLEVNRETCRSDFF